MDTVYICTWLLHEFLRTEIEWIVLDFNWQHVRSECIMIPWCMGNIKWQHSWLSPTKIWLASESLGPLLPSHGGSAQLCRLAAGHVLWTQEGGLLVRFLWLSWWVETLGISSGLGVVVMLCGVETPEMCSWRNNISLPLRRAIFWSKLPPCYGRASFSILLLSSVPTDLKTSIFENWVHKKNKDLKRLAPVCFTFHAGRWRTSRISVKRIRRRRFFFFLVYDDWPSSD